MLDVFDWGLGNVTFGPNAVPGQAHIRLLQIRWQQPAGAALRSRDVAQKSSLAASLVGRVWLDGRPDGFRRRVLGGEEEVAECLLSHFRHKLVSMRI